MTNAYLMTLQAEYLQSRSNALKKELFSAILEMAQIQVKSLIKRKHLFISSKQYNSVCLDICLEILERYGNEAWRVNSNYGKVIELAARKHLFDSRYISKIQYCSIDTAELPAQDDRKARDDYLLIARAICAITDKSRRVWGDARRATNYSRFIAKVLQYQSINWVDMHTATLRGVWEYRRWYDGNEKKDNAMANRPRAACSVYGGNKIGRDDPQ